MPLTSADLIVEDGTVVADANAYITISFADSYHLLRANAAWAAATEAEKVAAIVNATDYTNTRWTFIGVRADDTQSLEWPRLAETDSTDGPEDVNGVEQVNNVPLVVRQVTAEYAARALAGALLPDPTIDENGKFITLKREKVGPLEEETRFSEVIGRQVIKPYPAADRRMAASGLVVTGGPRVIHA